MRRRFTDVLTAFSMAVMAVTAAGSCGAWHWLLDLTSHFRAYWLLAAAVIAVLGLRRPRSLAFVCSLLALAGNAWALLPCWLPVPGVPSAATGPGAVPPLRLVSCNVLRTNPDKSRAVAYLRARGPDVAVLLEVDAEWATMLSSLDGIYPFRIVEPREDGFGLAILSRWPLSERRSSAPGGAWQPSLAATVRFQGRDVRLFATHPLCGLSAARADALVAQLGALADAAAAAPGPCIVAGDFNATPWSLAYRVFAARSGLRDTALGRGPQPTWNARVPAPRIPIDHVFASPGLAVLRRDVGPDVGSDHFPVEVDLAVPPVD